MNAQITELRTGLSTLSGNINKLVEGFSASQQPQAPAPAPAAKPVEKFDPVAFDKAYRDALDDPDNKGASPGTILAKALETVKQEVIENYVRPLEQAGLSSIGSLTMQSLVQSGQIPYYAKNPEIKKEVDSLLGQLAPNLRTNEEVIRRVYHSVVGSKFDTLIDSRIEEVMRSKQENPGAPSAGARVPVTASGAGTDAGNKGIPTVEDLGGSAARQALQQLGQGGKNEDQLAQALGYKDFNHYMTVAKEIGFFGDEGRAQ